ncbi:MAG: ATP-dependent zinc metalloprotease FtsH, partial [Chloroflexi bacterium]|nr:ATP-dependent zinc metalloprotease FtsH [Chloroflexota bacterium]
MNQRLIRNSIVYVLILVAVIAIFWAVFSGGSTDEEVTITQIVTTIRDERGSVKQVIIDGDKVTLEFTDPDRSKIKARKEKNVGIQEYLTDAGVPTAGAQAVPINIKQSGSFGNLFGLFLNFLPLIFFGAIILFMMRQAQGSNSQAMSFGKSRARKFVENRPTVTFSDVAGIEEAKQELQEVVEFLTYPERFASLGARIPKGVLLVGPPGTGKTLLAKAIAGEADVPFYNISGSDFVEMFVGVGASRVRDLFRQARDQSPCIIFLDEIDAVGRRRGSGMGGGHDEREQTLNAILVEMDGFESDEKIIVMAATNRPDVLDPALLRPGRFDRHIYVDAPDIKGREEILKVHTQNKTLASQVELITIAKFTPGFTGADLENLVNEAALLAVKRDKEAIDMSDLEEARDKVLWGREKRSRVIPKSELLITAYHESGHALVGYLLEETDKPHKVS